jgi:NO-binding membrane sensor protein with MHYT domain
MTCLVEPNHNSFLVVLSVVIAIVASYTALDLAGRVNATHVLTQVGWLVAGTTAMGTGIWSMHFVGMLAFRLPVTVDYHYPTVLISVVPSVVAAGAAFFLVSRASLFRFSTAPQ